jgi:hypothetical protein
MAPARHGGQKVWLVDDHDVFVPMQHGDVERHRHLVAQVAVEVDAGTGRQHGGGIENRTVLVDDLTGDRLGGNVRPESGQ